MPTNDELRAMAETLESGPINVKLVNEAAAMFRSILAEREAKFLIAAQKAADDMVALGTGVTFVSQDGTISHVPLDEYRKTLEDKDQ